MATNAGRVSREWHDLKLMTQTKAGAFTAMKIMLWVFGLYSKSNGKTMENFKQRSNMIRCTFFFFFFLGPHPQHMEVPRLEVESDPSRIFNLHHSSWQHQILDPLSEARDRTHILMGSQSDLFPLSHDGNSSTFLLKDHCEKGLKGPKWMWVSNQIKQYWIITQNIK